MSEPMTVIDPLNKMNNTTRNAFRIKNIQEVFKKAYSFLIDNQNEFKEKDHCGDVIVRLTAMKDL